MSDVSGSLRGVSLDGTSFRVPADADVTMKFSSFETEGIPTSGDTMYKKTIISPNHEGVPLTVNGDEIELLEELAARNEPFPMSVNLASGDEFKCQGMINFGDTGSADMKAEVDLIPSNALTGWNRF
jgi:hypothetical protein